jgi:hypothetical protein
MADPKTTAGAPFWIAVRRSRFCAAWPARPQETVQVELIAASFDSLRSSRPARAISER